ncbi:MAG TPA: ABC transporter substrate-binding protein [Ilumatobacteraceae bacterium]|nr:ABC transporter substrate-binding protein [Ilumatobacteraceae bacterium]
MTPRSLRAALGHRCLALAAVAALTALAACSSDTEPADSTPQSSLIPAERCAANKAVGTITYLSGFDFAATPGIVDVVMAHSRGYYADLCLDVELRSSFSTANYPLVASNTAQFASAGNYTEIINQSGNGAEFVAVINDGKAPIEALITPAGGATTLEALRGKKIGFKGDIPPSIVAMLAKAGLQRGTDYTEISLDGFDPVAHIRSGVDAFPVYKSNEPWQLQSAGIEFNLFDPATDGIPGSFGIVYTSKGFVTAHPQATADFVRATLRGMADTIVDPAAAVAASVALINAGGNTNFLTEAGETFRLSEDLRLVAASTPAGQPVGVIDPALFDAEYAAYVAAGVWPDGAPADGHYYDADLAASLYDANSTVIWP